MAEKGEDRIADEPPAKRIKPSKHSSTDKVDGDQDGHAEDVVRDGHGKTGSQDPSRRESVLVMRLATKEQEIQELLPQIHELKASQLPSVQQLRQALLDPAVNLLFQRLTTELNDTKEKLSQAQDDMSAWKFTPDSVTGRKLMAKCRSLLQENQELGKQLSQGRIAQLEAELSLQKKYSQELKSSQDEMQTFILQLDEELEGMQSTIMKLQGQLRQTKQQLAQAEEKIHQRAATASQPAEELCASDAEAEHMQVDGDGDEDDQGDQDDQDASAAGRRMDGDDDAAAVVDDEQRAVAEPDDGSDSDDDDGVDHGDAASPGDSDAGMADAEVDDIMSVAAAAAAAAGGDDDLAAGDDEEHYVGACHEDDMPAAGQGDDDDIISGGGGDDDDIVSRGDDDDIVSRGDDDDIVSRGDDDDIVSRGDDDDIVSRGDDDVISSHGSNSVHSDSGSDSKSAAAAVSYDDVHPDSAASGADSGSSYVADQAGVVGDDNEEEEEEEDVLEVYEYSSEPEGSPARPLHGDTTLNSGHMIQVRTECDRLASNSNSCVAPNPETGSPQVESDVDR